MPQSHDYSIPDPFVLYELDSLSTNITYLHEVESSLLRNPYLSYRYGSQDLVMKAVLQRVASASVTVDNHLISSIGKGVLVFAAVASEDTKKEVESMAAKVLKMKLWPDETGATKWKRNVQDIKGEVLCVYVARFD